MSCWEVAGDPSGSPQHGFCLPCTRASEFDRSPLSLAPCALWEADPHPRLSRALGA